MPQDNISEKELLQNCVGALQFILKFYDPTQRFLDTEAWKVACNKGVTAFNQAADAINWQGSRYTAYNGQVSENAPR